MTYLGGSEDDALGEVRSGVEVALGPCSAARDSVGRTPSVWFVGFQEQLWTPAPCFRQHSRKVSRPQRRGLKTTLDGLTGRALRFPQEGRGVAESRRSCGHRTRNRNCSRVLGHGLGTRMGQTPCSCTPSNIPETLGATFMSEHLVGVHCRNYHDQGKACCMNVDASDAQGKPEARPGERKGGEGILGRGVGSRWRQ